MAHFAKNKLSGSTKKVHFACHKFYRQDKKKKKKRKIELKSEARNSKSKESKTYQIVRLQIFYPKLLNEIRKIEN